MSSWIGGSGPSEFAPGTSLCRGRFIVEAFVGRGGVGAAYRARDVELERVVVCKITHGGDELAWKEARGQFEKLARINTRDVVRCLGFFVDERDGARRPVLVFEWVDGDDFAHWARTAALHDVLKAITRISTALAELHETGLEHGDCSDGMNVRITRDGRVVLIDPDSEITAGSFLASDRPALARLIRQHAGPFTAGTFGPVVLLLDDRTKTVPTRDIALQITSAVRAMPLLAPDPVLVAVAGASYRDRARQVQERYDHIRLHRAAVTHQRYPTLDMASLAALADASWSDQVDAWIVECFNDLVGPATTGM